jgi:hypothetical protein
MGNILSQIIAYDDDSAEFGRSSTNFSNTTMGDGVTNAEDKDLADKLMAQLKEKNAELEKNKQGNKVCTFS